MPVIKKKLPDGSTEVINSPSVIIKDPTTGKFKKAPTKRYIIPAEGRIDESQKSGANSEILQVSTEGNSIQSNLAIGPRNNAPIQQFQAPIAPDQVAGTVAFFGTLLARAVQFFTRTGNPSLRGDTTNNSTLSAPAVSHNSTSDSVLPAEAVVKQEKDVAKELKLDPKDAEEVEKIKSANQKKKKKKKPPILKDIDKAFKKVAKAGKKRKKSRDL